LSSTLKSDVAGRVLRTVAVVAGLALAAANAAWAQTAQAVQPPVHHHQPAITGAVELFPPRDASGTGWFPDGTPMSGWHRVWNGWSVMVHGNVVAQLIHEPGEVHRTGGFSTTQASSSNWGMLMARRPLGNGRLGIRAMVSAEPWTIPGCGSLNFLASGELCEGDTIHDRQHPHDLLMELAADYDRPLRKSLRWQVYAGLSGEPALGPTSFPHRLSAIANPTAPIAHHWLDSTHITFGLITTGIYSHRWKAEMSLFNGREPDEQRTDLDLGALDSVSGRIWYLPTTHLAFQVSAGHLHGAEQEFAPSPRSSVDRLTASVTDHRPVWGNGFLATTVAFGVNSGRTFFPGGVIDQTTPAGLIESSLTLAGRHTWFARAEVVGKPADDLHVHEYITQVFTVGKLQGGYVRQFAPRAGMVAGIGGTVAASIVPPLLASRYEGRVAPGFSVFMTLRPHGM
jgi:hypothetical protein